MGASRQVVCREQIQFFSFKEPRFVGRAMTLEKHPAFLNASDDRWRGLYPRFPILSLVRIVSSLSYDVGTLIDPIFPDTTTALL